MMSYVERIRALREDHDKTQREVAEYLGTSQTMYARYERSANELPLRHLISLCRYYDVSADYLLGLESERRARENAGSSGEEQTTRAYER